MLFYWTFAGPTSHNQALRQNQQINLITGNNFLQFFETNIVIIILAFSLLHLWRAPRILGLNLGKSVITGLPRLD